MDKLPVPLPPTQIRQGGGPLRFDDSYFIERALQSVEVLTSIGLEPGMRMVDFGCGPGRLAIGLIASEWSGFYLGIDVKPRAVNWASREITSRFPAYEFVRVDAANARYNPKGSEPRHIPSDDKSVDLICAFSVFSHMLSSDTNTYLTEFRRVLDSGGKGYITAYVEDGVPDETENPPWFGEWKGSLHCVLYSTEHLTGLVKDAGFTIEQMIRRGGRKQTGLVLVKASSA